MESINVTFDDTKLPSLQRDKDSESLEFEDSSEDLEEEEEEVPAVVIMLMTTMILTQVVTAVGM
ncbi:hypothetical protein ACR2XN_28840 [Klebsiella pneumoniae]